MNNPRAWRCLFTFAGRGLLRRPVQTVLLLIALTVSLAGTMSIMAVLSGIEAQLFRDLKRVGLDVVNVQMVPNLENLFVGPLVMEDTDWMLDTAGGGQLVPFRAELALGANPAENASGEFLLLETTPGWGEVVPLDLAAGRFLKKGETGACVLDEQVARIFFPQGNAVGRDLFVGVGSAITVLKVVGVLKDPFEIRQKFDELDFAGSARATLNRMLEFKSVYVLGDFEERQAPIHGALIQVPPGAVAQEAAKRVHREAKDRNLPAIAWARSQWVDNVVKGADLTTQVAGMLWIIVLLVTGVMILTISLVAIRERYRELAIRRTEGARRMEVVGQLLLENLLLSLVAGLLALALAKWAAIILEARYLSWAPEFLPHEMALALGLGALIGLLATVLPAWRAASLDPVRVLRRA